MYVNFPRLPQSNLTMEKIEHTTVSTNGINMHIASIGTGPAILFLHGFPQLWYSWRHQLLALSAHGYRAIAPDLRGYGDTDSPPSATSYSALHIVGDLVGLLDALGLEKVFLVGHDWGAIVGWNFCHLRPDRINAYFSLSVPFFPRNPKYKPMDGYRAAFGDDFYVCRFQKPGEAEADFAQCDTRGLIKKFFSYRDPRPFILPKEGFKGIPEVTELPSWISEDDISYYATKFEQKGFTGGLNYYRAVDLTWELMAPWTGSQIKVPAMFIMGDLDLVYNFPGVKDYIQKGGFKKDVPLLQDAIIMEGVGHFINEEKPEEISSHIYDFVKQF